MMYLMMLLFSFFAAYGIVQLISKWVFAYRTEQGEMPICYHTVLGVKNAEDSVEGIFRTMTWENQKGEIIILDFGSEDETTEILYRLSLKYPCLHAMRPEEYISYLRALQERADTEKPFCCR